MRQRFLTIVLVVFVASCASTRAPIIPPVNSSFTVQINKQFDSLPNYTRLYFQDGIQIPKTALDRWTIYCRLHVYNPDKQADYLASVKPGKFGISKVTNRAESSDNPIAGSASYASFGVGLFGYRSATGLDSARYDPPSYYLYRVDMKLTSPDQPDVQSLICSRKSSSRGNYYPTLSEIRHALGDLIKITPLSTAAAGP